jgi:hypothetical protein
MLSHFLFFVKEFFLAFLSAEGCHGEASLNVSLQNCHLMSWPMSENMFTCIANGGKICADKRQIALNVGRIPPF